MRVEIAYGTGSVWLKTELALQGDERDGDPGPRILRL